MKAHKGFTLIEVMVVIAILSITVSFVVVNLKNDEQSLLEQEARRLAMLLEYAHSAAILEGQSLALNVHRHGYDFARKPRDGPWQPLDIHNKLTSRVWPERFTLAEQRIAGAPSPAGDAIVFSTSGVNLPYELVLGSGAWRVTLAGDFGGKVRVARGTRNTDLMP